MRYVPLVPLWLVFYFSFALGEPMEPGSCSRKCRNTAPQSEEVSGSEDSLLPFPCSCSSSCLVYKDCCSDSEFRKEDVEHVHTICLSLSNRGQFRAVAKCPMEWSESSAFCSDSIGHLPPVTSRTTGTTYSNIYCAVCHGDEKNLKTWNVELRCCPEHDDLDESTERNFTYKKGHLWSRISGHKQCPCKYFAHYNDTSFINELELRTCDKRLEISKCSSSWTNNVHQDLCKSFLDPIYVGDKVYRNQFCAECNFKGLESAKCMPSVVNRKLSEGLELAEIFKFCMEHRLNSCLYYLMSSSRGNGYSFSSLLNIYEQTCVPPNGRRCCQGERYDFRAKRCRTLRLSN